jgi:hypothetical protein
VFRIRDPVLFLPVVPGSGMNIPDHISESLETIFWIRILKFFDANPDPVPGSGNLFDPGSGKEKIRIRIRNTDKKKHFQSSIREKIYMNITVFLVV